jgi:hypothetical protein
MGLTVAAESEVIGRCPLCRLRAYEFGAGATYPNSYSNPSARRAWPGARLEAWAFRFFAIPIAPSGPAPCGGTSRPCGPLCYRASIAG